MSIQNCLICNSAETVEYIHLKSNGLVALKCMQCGHVFVKNSPITSDNISDYYTMEDFKGKRKAQDLEYPDYYSDCFVDYEKHANSSLVLTQFQEKADYFDSLFPQKGRILDVGCATGVFLDMMRKRGWHVEGIEVSDELASYARENFSLQVHCIDIARKKLHCEPFHVVTLFDVIEHIPDPNLMIASIRDLMVDDGFVLIRTPAEEALLRDIAKMLYLLSLKRMDYPLHWFYSLEHIHSFSLNTLSMLLKKYHISISKVYWEDESLDRLTIPEVVKMIMKGINYLSSILKKSHKITVIGQKSNFR